MPPKKPVMKAVHKPKADFKKLRRKVGKTAPAPQNLTKTTITAKTIAVPLQQLEEKSDPTNSHNQSLADLMIMLVHYNAAIRRDAFSGMNDLFNRHPGLFSKEIPRLIGRLGEGLIDPAPEVRNACCTLTYQHLGTISEGRMTPLLSVYMQYIVAALSHIDTGIRADSSHFFRLLLVLYPSLVRRHCHQVLPNFSNLLADRNIAASQAQSASLSAFTSSSMTSTGSTFLPSASVNAARMQRATNSSKKHQIKALGAAGLFGSNSTGNGEEDQVTALLMRGASTASSLGDLSTMQVADLNSFTSVFNLDTASSSSAAQAVSSGLLNTSTNGMNHMHLSLSLLDASLRLHAPPAEAQCLEDILSEYMEIANDNNERSTWRQVSNARRMVRKNASDASANINAASESDSDSEEDSEEENSTVTSTTFQTANTKSAFGGSSSSGIVFGGRTSTQSSAIMGQVTGIPLAEQKPVYVDATTSVLLAPIMTDPLSALLNAPISHSSFGLGSGIAEASTMGTSTQKTTHGKLDGKSNVQATASVLTTSTLSKPLDKEPASMFSGLPLPARAGGKGNTANSNTMAKNGTNAPSMTNSNAHLLSGTRANVGVTSRPDMSPREHLFSIYASSDELVSTLIDCWVENFPLEWLHQEDRERRGSIDMTLSRHYDLHGMKRAESNKIKQNGTGENSNSLKTKQKGSAKGGNQGNTNAKALSTSLSILGYVASCLLSLARCDIAVQRYRLEDQTRNHSKKNASEGYFDRSATTGLVPPLENHLKKLMTHVLPYFPLSATSTHDIRAVATVNLSLAHYITLLVSTTPAVLPPTPLRLVMKEYHDKNLTNKQLNKIRTKQAAKITVKNDGKSEDPLYARMNRKEWDDFTKQFESVREFEQALLEYVMASYHHHREQELKSQTRLAARMEIRERSLYGYDNILEKNIVVGSTKRKVNHEEMVDDVPSTDHKKPRNTSSHFSQNTQESTSYLGIAPLPDLIRTTWALLPHVTGPVQTWLVDTFSVFYASCSVTPLSPAKLQCVPLVAALLHVKGNGPEWFRFGFAPSLWLPSLPQLLASALESCASQKPLTAGYTARSLAMFPLRSAAACLSAVISYSSRVYRAPTPSAVAQTLPLSVTRRAESVLRHQTSLLQRAVLTALENRRMNSDLGGVSQTVLFTPKPTGSTPNISDKIAAFDWDSLQGEFAALVQNPVDCVLPPSAKLALEDVCPLSLATSASSSKSYATRLYQPGPIFSMLASEQTQRAVLHSSLFATLISPSLLSALAFLCRFSSNSPAAPFGEDGVRRHRDRFGKESKLLPSAIAPALRVSLIELVSRCRSRIPTSSYISFLLSCCIASSDLTAHPAFSPAFHLDPVFLASSSKARREEKTSMKDTQDSLNTSVVDAKFPEYINKFTSSPLVHMLFPLAQLSHPAITAAVISALSNLVIDSERAISYISSHPDRVNDVTNFHSEKDTMTTQPMSQESSTSTEMLETKSEGVDAVSTTKPHYSPKPSNSNHLLVVNQPAQGEILLDTMSNMMTTHFSANAEALSSHYIGSLYATDEHGLSTASSLFNISSKSTSMLASAIPLSELPSFINIGRLSTILSHILQLGSRFNTVEDTSILPTLSVTLFRSLARALVIWLPLLCEAHIGTLPMVTATSVALPSLEEIDFPAQPEAPGAVLNLLRNVPGLFPAVLCLWSNSIIGMTKSAQNLYLQTDGEKQITFTSMPLPSLVSMANTMVMLSNNASLVGTINASSESTWSSHTTALMNLFGMPNVLGGNVTSPMKFLPKMYAALNAYSNAVVSSPINVSDSISNDAVISPLDEGTSKNLRSAIIVLVNIDPNLA